MIRCNRCGNMTPAGAVSCQSCGEPLSSKVENEFSARMGAQGQPVLPAWLESLRAGERSAAPADTSNSQPGFSAADLIEEGTLPSWMRPERAETNDRSGSNPQLSLRASSLPGPNTDEEFLPAQGLAAHSLIDEQSLPSWMREGQQQTGAMPPQNGMNASSLVQSDAVPDWMKNVQPSEAMPDWMKTIQQPSASPSGPMQAMPPTPSVRPSDPISPIPQGQGFSARDLIDQQALPSWMSGQSGHPSAAPDRPSAPAPAGNAQSGQPGLSASSLLDMDSLPRWLRENGQGGGGQGGNQPWQATPQPMQTPSAQYGQPWQGGPSMQTPLQNTAAPHQAPGGSGLAASSFIDMNSLPDWLRSASEQQQRPGMPMPQAGTQRPGPVHIPPPPRVENVRVPSRPRSEMNPAQGSEAAANVFASMLGVASTPSYSPPSPNTAQGQPGGQPPTQQGMPQGMPGGAQAANAPGQIPVPGTAQGMAGAPPIYAAGGYGAGYPGQGAGPNQGNYPMGTPPAGAPYYPANTPGVPPMSGPAGMTGEQREQAKSAKRGFFKAIHDWFFH